MIITFFLIGIAVGSFLNVVIDRLPNDQSLLRPPSHCPNCNTQLARKDLIPILSYLRLRGRCRYCQSRIPQRMLWIELATGIVFALLWWHYGPWAEFALLAVYFCLFEVIFFIDLDHQLILNKIVYPASIFALATVSLNPEVSLPEALIGGAVGLGLLLGVVIASRGGMGLGDVKMAGLMGLALGFPVIFVALFVGIVIGGIFAIGLLLMKKRGRKAAIPFGPFLAIGAVTALIWGQSIWDWYTGA